MIYSRADMRPNWIVGQAEGLRPLPNLMKNRTSDNSHLCSVCPGHGMCSIQSLGAH